MKYTSGLVCVQNIISGTSLNINTFDE